MGRPKGSKNKQKSGRVQVKAVKVGRRGRPAGSVNARRAETVTTSGYSREEQSAVETVAQLTLADRILRIEQGLTQLNGYMQNVVNNFNAYIQSTQEANTQAKVTSPAQELFEKGKSNGSHAAAVAAAPAAAVKEVKRGRPAKAAVKAAPVEVTTEDDVMFESELEEDDFEEEDLSDDFDEDESVI
jgi:hypothetical protein